MGLSADQKALVTSSLGKVTANISLSGGIVFEKLITDGPEFKAIFGFPGKRDDPAAQALGSKVLTKVAEAVGCIDDQAKFSSILHAEGVRHKGRKTEAAHFSKLGPAIIYMLGEVGVAADAQAAWGVAFGLISGEMIKGLES